MYKLIFPGLIILLALAGCGGGGGGSGDDSDNGPSALDNEVLARASTDLGLTGDPAAPRSLTQTRPSEDDLVKLGQILFFSKSLSGGFDVACASCHHPDFAGGDSLSLPVGVNAAEPSLLGPGRILDPNEPDLDPLADGGPNVPRNSQTVFNTAFYSRAMFHDGRVFVLDDETVPQGEGQRLKTPEGGNLADPAAGNTLLAAQAKLPIPSNSEMRDFLYTNYATPVEYREHLIRRLRGEEDQACCFDDPNAAAANWLDLFQAAYGSGTAAELITQANVQEAIAAYEASMIFVNSPWKRYLAGNYGALSKAAKKGAKLFLNAPEDGGLGCVSCHSGDRFTDEQFHNVGFPQIGRGKRIDHEDPGRWLTTSADADRHAFRTPSLLNVAETAPYGHAGTFATLEEVIDYHADPRRQVDVFDFTLQHLEQFQNTGIVYDHAEPHTRTAIAHDSLAQAEALLPGRTLNNTEVNHLAAFLRSLTDKCVADLSCVDDWTPRADEDPDGHLLVRGQTAETPDVDSGGDVEDPGDYPNSIALDFPGLAARTTFADVEGCTDNVDTSGFPGTRQFVLRSEDPDFGLDDPHGFEGTTWFNVDFSQIEAVMIAGGVSAAYLDDDCYPDLVFAGGDDSGMVLYENLAGTGFQAMPDALIEDPGTRFTGAAVADLNGDYRRELLFGNLHDGAVPIYSPDGGGRFARIAELPMARHTYGMSFAPLDDSGYPYFYFAHWSGGSGSVGTSPALWKNDGSVVRPWDVQGHTTSKYVDQRFNFAPSFADFTGDGRQDLVLASDFGTSQTLVYRPDSEDGFIFENVFSEPDAITDENGMGATLLDRDNDGTLEWFVTSIWDPNQDAEGNWGITGNRLYEYAGSDGDLVFRDITDEAGVRNGLWGWGACAADFDNDGFIDLFHVNGFGYIPADRDTASRKEQYQNLTHEFQSTPPRLFMNNGDGSFTDKAAVWNADELSEGRGVVCFDYDRDGDVDIVLLDHSKGLQFLENQIGSSNDHFLSVRLVGEAPNTDAIGARVTVTANVGNGHGTQTMLRLSNANSNFNSQDPPDLHFGLGSATTATVEVDWPGDGPDLVCSSVAANQFVVLDQRQGQPACPE